jgi:hypothetical protein
MFVSPQAYFARRMARARPKSHLIGDASKEDVAAHYAHAAGRDCPRCGSAIEADQPARRVGDADWVHDICPAHLG